MSLLLQEFSVTTLEEIEIQVYNLPKTNNMDKIPLIEKDIQTMSEAIKEMKSEMKNHREDMNAHRQDFQAFKEELFDKMDSKFASKWVEKFILWAL